MISAYLVLESGQIFEGTSFGSPLDNFHHGELVFQTGMVGYPESLTDPSYTDQILTLTYPIVGNYGVPDTNEMDEYGLNKWIESDRIRVSGLIVQEYVDQPSHWQSTKTLGQWLKEEGIPGISGIDTRHLTKLIREEGTVRAVMTTNPDNVTFSSPETKPIDRVVSNNVQVYNPRGNIHVLAIDCGIKYSQIKNFINLGCKVTRVPHDFDWLQMDFDRLFISNGPGDPQDAAVLIKNLELFMAQSKDIPIFGICLGHQILALAAGARTYKMKYGNRGHNLPCILAGTERCFITTQNHGYAVDPTTLTTEWLPFFTNANDGTNEGIYHKSKPYYSVQFHPEANAGSMDTNFLFESFVQGESIYEMIEKNCLYKPIIKERKKVIILGSGGLSIGQSGEFDYSGSQAIKAYNEEGLMTILINPNIATVQTSPGFADKVYFLPVTPDNILQVIKQERPDCITASFGGQTALNAAVQMYKEGIFEKYGIEILGSPIQSVIDSEDRDVFAKKLQEIGESVPPGRFGTTLKDAIRSADELGYPVLVRAAYALGGLGSGFAHNQDELEDLVNMALSYSNQITIDKSLKGWKEIEYEVVRDAYDNCICVCNMENFDPLGVHTGESIVVAPSQTLSDYEYNMLRTTAIKTIRMLGIVGECNIQYTLNPETREYYIIEVNARLSRSSALASKATGYPLAYVAAKLSLGQSLVAIRNSITKRTTACFEPSLDYCVVKVPRWDLRKFPLVSRMIDSAMKSIGESMGIGRSFEEAFQKALRMSNENTNGFEPHVVPADFNIINDPQYDRVFALASALYDIPNTEWDILNTLEEIHKSTGIDMWYLYKLSNIIVMQHELEDGILTPELLYNAKRLGFNDKQIAKCVKSTELIVRNMRVKDKIIPITKQIDTVAGEFPCYTNYLYNTYNAQFNDSTNSIGTSNILTLGSGVYKIGSSVEFDWCTVNCIRELKNLGYGTIMINCNPETVSTDYDEADKLYFEEISFESVMDVVTSEKKLDLFKGVVVAMGGQLSNNIAMALYRQGVNILGTSPEMIDSAENRYKFSRMLDSIGVDQPKWKELTSVKEAKIFCQSVGYPCLVRPSYVLSGAAMNIAYGDCDLEDYLSKATAVSKDYPVVISKYISDAKEIEVDAVVDDGILQLLAISEHVENAGVHSGDATLILPPQDLTQQTIKRITQIVVQIAKVLNINGPCNIQFIAKDDLVKVIECNLRVSRSFPFVSKTLGTNFALEATKVMLGLPCANVIEPASRIGVKVPMFSFHRLKGADIGLGVEMLSTGEVGCFGENKYEAFYKGVIAAGHKFPKQNQGILVSIGSYGFKREFLEPARKLSQMGYQLYGTYGTSDYYNDEGLNIIELPLYSTNEDINDTILDYLANGKIGLVVNISKKNKIRCADNSRTDGYKMRRASVENDVSLLTDIKFAKMFVSTMCHVAELPYVPIRSEIDCFANYDVVRLPGLIDVHVHIREPGPTYKGDWSSETKAALAGGFTAICCMPNTTPAITGPDELAIIQAIASQKSHCDYGLYVGANDTNYETLHELAPEACALKMYLNNTYGPLLLQDTGIWAEHIKHWDYSKPLCVHAEGKTLGSVLHLANIYNKPIHVCHVSSKEEIELIRISKEVGMRVTCEVAPHHLFMDCEHNNIKAGCTAVKPPLMLSADRQALWDNLSVIDCFATDHAPHTLDDKLKDGCPGYPGLETALPLLLTAVKQGRLTIEDIILRYHTNPKRIYGLPDQPDTYIEVDMKKEWIIPEKLPYSKCGWTPFAGMKVNGLVKRVVLRGKVVFVDGQILAKEGYGQDLSVVKQPTVKIVKSASVYPEVDKTIKPLPLKPLTLTHITSVEQFDRDMLRLIFQRATEMKQLVLKQGRSNLLQDKVLASIFYEPSTRTRCSFTAAMKRLGGEVVEVNSLTSSVTKGETLEDFIRCMECYTDVLVLRSSDPDSTSKALSVITKPFINAGNGTGEHPTQALLDAFTIREERGSITGATITMVGDLKNGRTVHSLAKLLSEYDVRLRYVSPKGLEMPPSIIDYVQNKGIEQSIHYDLLDVLSTTDVLYVTRIQQERFDNQEDYEAVKGSYVITPQLLSEAKDDLVVLHPLPRVDEISIELDDDPRAAYFRQMENGLYIRMALLVSLFGR